MAVNVFDNLLPRDGLVAYHPELLSKEDADRYFEYLMHTIDWRSDELLMFGKRIVTKRKVAWYGDRPYEYTYSHSRKKALPWIEGLLELKDIVESHTGEVFNSCLLNLYHSGSEGMSWHSDDEKDLQPDAAIASLSLGVARHFIFRHKTTREKVELILQHGSLLEMKGTTQSHWQHALPPSKKVLLPRINLTFRSIVEY